jgi:hypothetical protein
MALKESDLYSSLWASCDELRGGMDGCMKWLMRLRPLHEVHLSVRQLAPAGLLAGLRQLTFIERQSP